MFVQQMHYFHVANAPPLAFFIWFYGHAIAVVVVVVVNIVVAGLFKRHLKNLIVYFPFGYYSANHKYYSKTNKYSNIALHRQQK